MEIYFLNYGKVIHSKSSNFKSKNIALCVCMFVYMFMCVCVSLFINQ